MGPQPAAESVSGVTDPGVRTSQQAYNRYEPYRTVEAVGGWIGLMICRDCGAVLMLDERLDVGAIHDAWHESP